MGLQTSLKFLIFAAIAFEVLDVGCEGFHIKPDLPLEVDLSYTTAADEKFVQFSFELSIPNGLYGELSMRDLQVSYFFNGLPGGSVENYDFFCDYARPELGNKSGVLGNIISLVNEPFRSKGIQGANYALVVTFASSWALEPGKSTRNIRVRVGYRDGEGKLVNFNDTEDYSYRPPIYEMDYYLGRLALANQPNDKIEVVLREDGRILHGVSPAEKVRLDQERADAAEAAARARAEAIAAYERAEAERLRREALLALIREAQANATANNGTTVGGGDTGAGTETPIAATPPPPAVTPPPPPAVEVPSPTPTITTPPPIASPSLPSSPPPVRPPPPPPPSPPPMLSSPPPSSPPPEEPPASAAPGQLRLAAGLVFGLVAVLMCFAY
eukprot:jgi/Mesvir1/23296/Mv20992-RA.1